MSAAHIRRMKREETALIGGFPPPEWNTDAPAFFTAHFDRPYFHPVVAEEGGALVGIANALVFGDTAWLGHIIVAPEHRRQGVGRALTEYLIEYCRRRGCREQILIATPLGRPVYQACGFSKTGEYVILEPGRPVNAPDLARVRPAAAGDFGAIADLDRRATAEDRRPLLERFREGGIVHWSGNPDRIDGFFLPAFDQGPVIAANDAAGFTLLQFKHGLRKNNAGLPAGNTAAIKFLIGLGFSEKIRVSRMALGRDLPWRQEMIYARGAGYCG